MVKTFGISTWLFVALSIVIVFVFLLANVNRCESVEFCATNIFFIIMIASNFMLVWLHLINHESAKNFVRGIQWFYMRDITLRTLVWIPIGLGGVFLASYIGVVVQQPILSIFLSGFVMLFAFYRTHCVPIPIVIHGLYNSAVVALRAAPLTNSFITDIIHNSPINVPDFGLSIGQLTSLSSEIIFQIFLVALAEELFKVFIIAFVIVALRGTFDGKKNDILTWIAGAVAVGIWGIYHTVSALR